MVKHISHLLRVWAAATALAFFAFAPLAQAEVSATLDHSVVAEGDTLILHIQVLGDNDAEPDVSPLRQNFDILGQSQSSQIQFINGTKSASRDWFIQLVAKTSGKVQIPPIAVGDETTQPISIETAKANASTNNQEHGDLYLEVEVDTPQAYVQSQVLYKVRLYHRIQMADGASLTAPDSSPDFLTHKIGEDKASEEIIDGNRYGVIERTYSLFPQKSGKLLVPSVQFQGNILDRNNSFAQPFGGMFPQFGQSTRPVRLRSESPTIEVLPKPNDWKGQWWLPAQSVTLEEEWSGKLDQWKSGEPMTRTIKLIVEGLLDNQLPEINPTYPGTLKTYPDQPNRATVDKTKGVMAVLDQKVALIPTQSGDVEIPAYEIQWWDIQHQRMQVARLPAKTIPILPGDASAPVSTPTPQPLAINPIVPAQPAPTAAVAAPQVAPANTTAAALSLKSNIWFWCSLGLLLAWLTTLALWILNARNQQAAPAMQTDASPEGTAKYQLAALQRACEQNNPTEIRRALLAWAEAQWPAQRPISFFWISEHLGCPELATSIQTLDASRYGPKADRLPADFGKSLWLQLQPCLDSHTNQKSTKSSAPVLVPLYP